MNLQELKQKTPTDLCNSRKIWKSKTHARKQDMLFAILKQLSANDVAITGTGVLEVLQDGFGFLRSPERIIYQGQTTSTYEPSAAVWS